MIGIDTTKTTVTDTLKLNLTHVGYYMLPNSDEETVGKNIPIYC